MNILITGATGFIGSDLTKELCKQGYRCKCLVRNIEKAKEIFKDYQDIEFVVGDVAKPETIQGISKDIDYVIHLAVLGHSDEANLTFNDYKTVNVIGTENLLNELTTNPVKRVVCFSSSAAVGLVKSKNITENTACNPQTPYGISKRESDLLINRCVKKLNLPIITLRFTHIYGPGDTRDFLKIVKLVKKGVFPIVGFKENLYPAVYKSDAINSILLALKNGKVPELYNISDSESHNLRLVAKFIKNELGIKRIPLWTPKYPTLLTLKIIQFLKIKFPVSHKNIQFITSGRRYSIDKAKDELGFEPRVNLKEGITKTIQWYKKEGLI